MPTDFSVTNDVQALFESFGVENDSTAQASPAADSEQTAQQENNNNFTPPSTTEKEQVEGVLGTKPPEEGKEKEEVEGVVGGKEKATEEDTTLIKDVSKFANLLREKDIISPYEDDTLPEKEEELIDALLQSSEMRATKKVEELWKEKVESLPETLHRIHEYASIGVTTAQELNQFIGAVAQQEAIGALDPANPEDQEQIVLIQLLNTGMTEDAAREEVADLAERKKLEQRAQQYFPTLKKSYEDNIRQIELDTAAKQEDLNRYIETNATNVGYFLEKDVEYLPFKFANNDKVYKQNIAYLASTPVEVTEQGTPVFAWQKQIEALQYGTEADYKKYMKVMAFLANTDKYEEGISKKAGNAATTSGFKKIKETSGKTVNTIITEQQNTIEHPQRQQAGAWSLKQ